MKREKKMSRSVGMAAVSWLLFAFLAACDQTVRTVVPENTPSATSIICPQATGDSELGSPGLSTIPGQMTFAGKQFPPLTLTDYLEPSSAGDDLTWTARGGNNLDLEINAGDLSATVLDPAWRGSETVELQVCDPSGSCAVQEIEYTVLADEALKITYTCNEGFIIETREKKVLIDALVWAEPPICSRAMVEKLDQMGKALPPFDNADLILVTHQHGDHFYLYAVGDTLKNNPNAILVTNRYAETMIHLEYDDWDQVAERIRVMDIEPGQTDRMTAGGIELEGLMTSPEAHSLGFILKMGGFTLFHAGDAGSGPGMPEFYRSQGLPDLGIDIAFVPWWNMIDPQEFAFLEEGVQARQYIPMHLQTDQGCYLQQILNMDPKAIPFTQEMESWWTMP
jgi:L-ascorbate metabolism protein UlaG (beta-lactamase superfamily)